MRLYGKHHFIPRLAASKEEQTHPAFCGLYFDAEGRTWASDGHILARFTGPELPAEEYPVIPDGPKPDARPVAPFTLPTEAAERVRKAIPKPGRTMPILASAALDTAESQNGRARFWTTDLEHPQRLDATKVEPEWPREGSERLLDKARERAGDRKVVLSAKLLEKLVKMAKELGPDAKWSAPIALYIPEPEGRPDPENPGERLPPTPEDAALRPVRFRVNHPDAGELEGLIMPMRT